MRDATLNVAVIGLGLIGGSVLRALAVHGHRVSGYDADPATRATARTAAAQAPANARWHVTGTIADAVRDADLTVVAVPLPSVGTVFDELASLAYVGVVTDVTSVKGPVRDLALDRLRTGGQSLATFIGGHPMAGRETSGFTAADPRLFEGCAWVLCLTEDGAGIHDWLELAALVTGLGARVVPATADEHDHAVAAISHVPHLVAAAMAARVASDPLAGTLGAGSFRDGTRVAAARPELTAAMCGGNAPAVLAALDAVLADLNAARAILDGSDPIGALAPWLTPGYTARLTWPPQPGETADLPARADVLLRLGRVGGWIESVSADRKTVHAVRPA
ncbi:prephenate dehydrogenase/arogenate dehydrogenase family protein [Dactylosporangium fulvum]|uniref:Prephenate dehydrogenase/arogenate dehydrogenase family protein n=1 Tax=Dactylosporangium fulvum TaxID=53359 RepID=A0ABY5VXG8_9ACTN|nr:prephenate dehydrogenase/arogenate dehydrogenase family protein [Dactylosporangium fulvum]UWP82315.1 prephenate dehydrogenase/arogenate dehydrogenase family protein [Dactylosporangium fulvum]